MKKIQVDLTGKDIQIIVIRKVSIMESLHHPYLIELIKITNSPKEGQTYRTLDES